MLVSVIIPALRADTELRRCVDSVRIGFGREYRYEIVVVLPPREVESARTLFPDETVIPETRASIYGAMNDGILASTGDFLYFLGKDDIVLPPFEAVLSTLQKSKPAAVFFDVYWGGAGVCRNRPSRLRVLLRNVCHQGVIYSRRAVTRHGPYLRRMRVEADKFFNVRLLWDSELASSIIYLPLAATWYSAAGFSSSARDPVFRKLYPAILRRHVGCWASTALVAVRRLLGR